MVDTNASYPVWGSRDQSIETKRKPAMLSMWHSPGAVVVVLGAVLVSGCGSAQNVTGTAHVVGVTEKDFKISAPKTIAAGDVVLSSRNEGPDEHELIVARVGALGLPLRTDGLTLNEEALERDEAGVLEPGAPGSVRALRVKLTPGRYVFFCNMAGHYLGGMHAEVVVQ
jgi:uncharacterized cupredoxin-like copper-binding protein